MDRARMNALMDRSCVGDSIAFEGVAAASQDELFRLAMALGLGREDAAEATQETLMRAYADRGSWKRGGDVMGWLCGIAVNVVREHRRRERQTTDYIRATMREGGEGATAEEAGLEPEELRKLAAAMEQLPPRQREAIACRYLRRMSIRETAEAMGCAEGTVKSAVAGALEKLQGVMECDHDTR